MRIKEVIFDFDGTVADSLEIVRLAVNLMSAELNIPEITPQMMPELMDLGVRELYKKFKIPLWRLPEIGIKLKKEVHLRMGEIKVFEQVIEAIAKLKEKGITVGMLTSNDKEMVTEYLMKNNAMVFDYIKSESNLFGKDKALKKLLKERKLDKSEVVYVGDEVRDVEACKRAGVKMAAVGWGFNSKKALNRAGADWVVDKPGDLAKLIFSL